MIDRTVGTSAQLPTCSSCLHWQRHRGSGRLGTCITARGKEPAKFEPPGAGYVGWLGGWVTSGGATCAGHAPDPIAQAGMQGDRLPP